MSINRVVAVGNESYRHRWVAEKLGWAASQFPHERLLDVGAGLSPYRSVVQEQGLKYNSHDFSEYVPSISATGLQDKNWNYPEHDFICDITQIPDAASSSVILCTEVLEHVPDPVRAFERICQLLKPNGIVIITVPFLSMMHQAPFWFQSGLSPFWFQKWCELNNLKIVELTIQGDFVDLMSQEISRLFSFSHRTRFIGKVASKIIQRLRPRISPSTLESGGLGTLLVAQKIS
jgi:SAM-dependent methyltransferase